MDILMDLDSIIAILVVLIAFFILRGRYLRRQEYLNAIALFKWDPSMSPTQFEQACADILVIKGWNAHITIKSGDQGIDIVAEKFGIKIILQCKKYSKPVGNRAVQEAHTGRAFAGADVAAVVSNMTYTPSAIKLAQSTGVVLLHFTDLGRADEIFGINVVSKNKTENASHFSSAKSRFRVERICPRCNLRVRLPKGQSGTVKCPNCGSKFTATT
jgi:hypothetical protein